MPHFSYFFAASNFTVCERGGHYTCIRIRKLANYDFLNDNFLSAAGKGTLVREVDALDGLMGLAADMGGIQFRTLNKSKGMLFPVNLGVEAGIFCIFKQPKI